MGDPWQCCLEIFLIVTTKEVAAGILCVEAREAAKHPTMHRTAPNNEELSSPKCQ